MTMTWLPFVLIACAALVAAIGVVWYNHRRRVARGVYRRTLESALADGMLTPEEIEELNRVRREKDLTSAEVRMVARTIYRGALHSALSDERLTPEEDQMLARLQLQLGLTEKDLGEDVDRLARLRLLARVERNELPLVDSPIALAPQEICHWVVQASLADRLDLHRRAHADLAGIRFDTTGIIPFNAEGARDGLRPNEQILPVDIGMFIVTSRRAIFQGARRSSSVAHARLETVTMFADGLRLIEAGGHSSGYILVEDAEVTTAILLHAARHRRAEIRPAQRGRTA